MKKIDKFLLVLVVILCLFVNINITNAQEQTDGLIFDEEIYNSESTIPQLLTSTSKNELPLIYSLKKWTPKVKSQGRIGSTVGWAVGYGAMSMMNAKANNWTDINKRTEEAFSALYIYNNIRLGHCNTGATFSDAGKLLMANGNCKSVDFDYGEDNCEKEASEALKSEAKKHKIKSYFKIFDSEDDAKRKVYEVKKNLAAGYPVVIGLQLHKNFYYPESIYWNPNLGNTAVAGGHAMVIVGYDDTRQAFEVMNSWGTSWGNEGFLWIKYEDFAKFVIGAYRFVINEENQPNPIDPQSIVEKLENYIGAFDFRYPIFDGDKIYDFKSVTPTKKDNYHYVLTKKNWKVGDMYQLVVTETQVNRAVYVFSIDAEGVNIHWPRDARLDELAKNETNNIPFEKVEIVIPDQNDALSKGIERVDHNIIILYAYGEIKDFKKRVLQVNNAQGGIEERFQAGFGDMVVSVEDINYSKDRIKFVSSPKIDKYIVPILITLEEE